MGVGKLFVVVVALLLAACTKANPNACCTTAEQCAAAELKDITGCSSGRVCDPFGACVKPQCSTSADCTSADTPICVGQLCVPKCAVDADCTGLAGAPHCAADGVCVACADDSQCTSDMPVCDGQTRSCRGCDEDRECADGVCQEAAGTCVADADVIYVRADGSDAGTCTAAMPCKTLPFAFQQLSAGRETVHIVGGAYTVATSVALPGRSVYLDGDDTVVGALGSGAVFATTSGSAIISHLTLGSSAASNPALAISGGYVELYEATTATPINITGGRLEVARSTLQAPNQCAGPGVLEVHDSTLGRGFFSQGCNVTLQRNRFDSVTNSTVLTATGTGMVIVENNVIISSDYFSDAMHVSGAPGSRVRFNTFANIGNVDMGAIPLTCDANTIATSNIFAWHSSSIPMCATKYSLFDTYVGLQPGTGNRVGDASTFFVDYEHGDVHLAPTSPARDGGEPGLDVTTDIDGDARNVASPDIGAYEAP